jgi:cytochrome c biogenesis protein CcmG/thiol:disulfide interchange protein DsbE
MTLPRLLEAFGILAVACLVSQACTPARPVKSLKTAHDFALNDSEGVRIRLSDYKGKVVLLNFWATFCHGCVLEIPWFIEFQERYKDSGLSIIGVSIDESWNPVKAFVEEKKVNYPIVLDNEGVRKLYELNSMPMTLLIDRNGEIAASYIGVVDKGACERKLRALLEENPPKSVQ